jgi:hypothetical protein
LNQLEEAMQDSATKIHQKIKGKSGCNSILITPLKNEMRDLAIEASTDQNRSQ